jgi:hypothetical protein
VAHRILLKLADLLRFSLAPATSDEITTLAVNRWVVRRRVGCSGHPRAGRSETARILSRAFRPPSFVQSQSTLTFCSPITYGVTSAHVLAEISGQSVQISSFVCMFGGIKWDRSKSLTIVCTEQLRTNASVPGQGKPFSYQETISMSARPSCFVDIASLLEVRVHA